MISKEIEVTILRKWSTN